MSILGFQPSRWQLQCVGVNAANLAALAVFSACSSGVSALAPGSWWWFFELLTSSLFSSKCYMCWFLLSGGQLGVLGDKPPAGSAQQIWRRSLGGCWGVSGT